MIHYDGIRKALNKNKRYRIALHILWTRDFGLCSVLKSVLTWNYFILMFKCFFLGCNHVESRLIPSIEIQAVDSFFPFVRFLCQKLG